MCALERPVRFLDALYFAIDGNFHASMKDKKRDEDDVPLDMGAGYFANEEAFAAFRESLGPPEAEVSLVKRMPCG